MQVKLSADKKSLIITVAIEERLSASGKSILIASSGSNSKTDLEYKGKQVSCSINAYIPNKWDSKRPWIGQSMDQTGKTFSIAYS